MPRGFSGGKQVIKSANTKKCGTTSLLNLHNRKWYTTIPEGEVNSDGYIYRDAKRRGTNLALFTDPEGIVVLVFTKSVG